MPYPNRLPPICPEHGEPRQRETCAGCNAAYMRAYLRRRNLERPALAMWHRAKKRADQLGLPFNLSRDALAIPERCPVLGMPLSVGEGRLFNSPSLDRIRPQIGYINGNCRVISDQANRLKGGLDLVELKARARFGKLDQRATYEQIVEYIDREELLAEVRQKAAAGGRVGAEWQKIADWLDRRFATWPAC